MSRLQPTKKVPVAPSANTAPPAGAANAPRKRPSFSTEAMAGATNSASLVKRVLLVDVVRLCAFFGHEAMDGLLQHLLTFLNDSVILRVVIIYFMLLVIYN